MRTAGGRTGKFLLVFILFISRLKYKRTIHLFTKRMRIIQSVWVRQFILMELRKSGRNIKAVLLSKSHWNQFMK